MAYTRPRKGPFLLVPTMDRFAVFVDAGYFFAAGGQAISGSPAKRQDVTVRSAPGLISALRERAIEQTGVTAMLRVYWYDAIPGPRMSLEHTSLAREAWLKLRLGSLNNAGEQKGVDSLIVTDIIELARNSAIVDAVLVSGDEDLRVAVQVAQSFGVRVHILAVGDPTNNVSLSLQMEADSVAALDRAWLDSHLLVAQRDRNLRPQSALGATVAATTIPAVGPADEVKTAAVAVCEALLGGIDAAAIDALRCHFDASTDVPPEFDRKLIAKTSGTIGRKLVSTEMRQIRGVFVSAVRTRGAGKP